MGRYTDIISGEFASTQYFKHFFVSLKTHIIVAADTACANIFIIIGETFVHKYICYNYSIKIEHDI